MTTYKVTGLVQPKQLAEVLSLFEERKIPYNVELNQMSEAPDRKPRKNGELTGTAFILQLLKRGSMNSGALRNAFEKDGRSPVSIASALHKLKIDKSVKFKKGVGYSLNRGVK